MTGAGSYRKYRLTPMFVSSPSAVIEPGGPAGAVNVDRWYRRCNVTGEFGIIRPSHNSQDVALRFVPHQKG
jgi:hypothetical protein